MNVRTCLLISDDPDDLVEFSEAVYEVSDNAVVLTIADFDKALNLLILKKCIPDVILLNTSITGLRPDIFFRTLWDDPALREIRIVVFGDSEFPRTPQIVFSLMPDVGYSELKEVLRKVIDAK